MLRCAELMPCSVVTSLWLSSSDFLHPPLSPLWRQVPWEMGNLWLDLSKEGINQTPCQPQDIWSVLAVSRRRWPRRNWGLRTDNAEEGGSDERRRKGRKEGKRDVGQGDEGEIKDEKTRNMHFKNASIHSLQTWTWRLTGTLSGFSYLLLFAGYKV